MCICEYVQYFGDLQSSSEIPKEGVHGIRSREPQRSLHPNGLNGGAVAAASSLSGKSTRRHFHGLQRRGTHSFAESIVDSPREVYQLSRMPRVMAASLKHCRDRRAFVHCGGEGLHRREVGGRNPFASGVHDAAYVQVIGRRKTSPTMHNGVYVMKGYLVLLL